MSIEKKCIDCNVIIVDEWFFTCNGFMCNRVISYNCATQQYKKLLTKFPSEVKKAVKFLMDEIQGLRWFCPECSNGLKNINLMLEKFITRSDKVDTILQKATLATASETTLVINDVDDRRVTRSKTKASPLAQAMTQTQTTSLSTINDIEGQPIQSPTPELQNILVKPQKHKNTLETQTNSKSDFKNNKSKQATQQENNPVLIPNVSDDIYSITVVKPRRWIFISRIHSSVTDEQFKGFLNCKFHLKDVNAIRMVPKAKNGGQYDYISYRISVDEISFANLINSKLWPPGLFIKEFEFTQNNNYFRTTGPTIQTT